MREQKKKSTLEKHMRMLWVLQAKHASRAREHLKKLVTAAAGGIDLLTRKRKIKQPGESSQALWQDLSGAPEHFVAVLQGRKQYSR